ncbi:E3 ubiquitin-protein ligase RNF14 [Cyphellophora attinorum]|uniref:E3 ubiquitin-protein ligase RNF14 n=1 Tax=Cyphellophora attinorum TaxID=1664694 RepID=A0A0N0NP99_9EURO|nr:E3 ubiquitin-protein ligase RNF14 [Phialophora attinorum]KPI42478.1 E3 ubiquitin-protein ligase RNF14 [Phialophora attinorum]
MAIFSRVRSKLSATQPAGDPHEWKAKEYSSSASTDRVTTIPSIAQLRNAFIPGATYSSPKEAFNYPDSSHAAVHLCLLECFRNLRLNAIRLDLQSYKLPSYSESHASGPEAELHDERLPDSVHWDVLVQLAATRFTTWWSNIESVLQHAAMYVIRDGIRSGVQLSANYLPPLDVLMVWYALMLDHGEYSRACHKAANTALTNLCFPWPAIRDVIDRESMRYVLPQAAQNLFKTISDQEADILNYLDTPPAYSESVVSPFNVDLVTQVHLQQPFVDDSHDFLWIRSPGLRGSLARSSLAYLQAQSLGCLDDIAYENLPYGVNLMWRTHRLFPARYSASRNIDFQSPIPFTADLKTTRSSETSTSSTSGSISRTQSIDLDVCICWTCERLRDYALAWVYDRSTKAFDLTALQSMSAENIRQVQDDVGFYRTVESSRRAGLPLPTRPPTSTEKEAERLEAKKGKDAGVLPGIGEYIEILPNGKTKIRVTSLVFSLLPIQLAFLLHETIISDTSTPITDQSLPMASGWGAAHVANQELMQSLRQRGLQTSYRGRDFSAWTKDELRAHVHRLGGRMSRNKTKLATAEELLRLSDSTEGPTVNNDRNNSVAPGPGDLTLPFAGEEESHPSTSDGLGGHDTTPRMCQVCDEERAAGEFPAITDDANCAHAQMSTCKSCMQRHITSESTSRALDEITCPEPNCRALLSFGQMQEYASAEVFERYDSVLCQNALSGTEDYCKCSNPVCDGGGFFGPQDSFITCVCGAQTCVTCHTAGHPGLTHDESKDRTREAEEEEQKRIESLNEAQSAMYVTSNTKACPKCAAPIERSAGCDHMTCRSKNGPTVNFATTSSATFVSLTIKRLFVKAIIVIGRLAGITVPLG